MRTSQLNVGTATDVSLKIMETDLSSLTATIRAPSGNEEPCLLKRLPNRHIGQFLFFNASQSPFGKTWTKTKQHRIFIIIQISSNIWFSKYYILQIITQSTKLAVHH